MQELFARRTAEYLNSLSQSSSSSSQRRRKKRKREAPGLWQSLVCRWSCQESTFVDFLGDDFWRVSVFYSCWFDSGYMLRQFSTRCRASVGTSLSVAVFAGLFLARVRKNSHRRCQGVFRHFFCGSSFLAATCSMSFWSTIFCIFWEIPSGNVPILHLVRR